MAATPANSTKRLAASASAAASPSLTVQAASTARPACRSACSPPSSSRARPSASCSAAMPIWRSPPASRGRPTSNISCSAAISPRVIRAAAWPRWTKAISPTWSSRRRSAHTSSNIASRRVDGRPGKLVGACLSDQQSDGLSMIYSFFDVGPDARKGLGTFIILDHIIRAARAGLPYVYLGYWVEGSNRMAYKTGFRRSSASAATAGGGWTRSRPKLNGAEPAHTADRVPARRSSRSRLRLGAQASRQSRRRRTMRLPGRS